MPRPLLAEAATAKARVSVVIATYNRRIMAEQAICSALAQHPAPSEIIVADDASTDGTSDFLRAVSHHKAWPETVKILAFQENLRVGNWNRAMDRATGDFIAWCSDDDRFLPGHLAASVRYLTEHPEICMVHSSFVDSMELVGEECVREPRPLRSAHPFIVNQRNLFHYMMRYYDWPFHPSTLVMRREVWEQTGPFNPHYELADTDWFVRVASRFSVAWLPRYGVLNRRHAGNWSNQVGSARMQREIHEILARAIDARWPGSNALDVVGRRLWKALWSTHVRLRLALTIRARLRTGHTIAALQSWQALVENTGRRLPGFLERAGAALIRRWAGAGNARVTPRQSVSPL